jgi:hypothetical protein
MGYSEIELNRGVVWSLYPAFDIILKAPYSIQLVLPWMQLWEIAFDTILKTSYCIQLLLPGMQSRDSETYFW